MEKVFLRTNGGKTGMKKTKPILIFAISAVALSLTACELFVTRITEHFGLDLRETAWISVEPSYPGYGGKLVFDYDEITVSGYTGGIGIHAESTRPFAEFPKDTPLKGNSVTGGPLTKVRIPGWI
jgi:hypothetical protein